MQVMIVDDSDDDRAGLRQLMAHFPEVTVVAEARSLAEAGLHLGAIRLDLLFLDVQLGRENGFDLLRGRVPLPPVVLTTVHRHLGSEAFDADVLDYLVKPVTETRLLRALQRAWNRLGGRVPLPPRVPVYRGGAPRHFVRLESIAVVVADGNYSRVFAGAHELEDHRSLREWDALLADRGFHRIDRSTLVRPSEVLALRPFGRGAHVVLRHSGLMPEIGARALKRLERQLTEGC